MDLDNAAKIGQDFIHFFAVLFHQNRDLGLRNMLRVQILKVRIYHGMQLPISFQHQCFAHIGHIVELLLHQFRIDILSTGAKDHVFAATADIDKAIGINGSDVSAIEPAIPQHLSRSFLKLVVSFKHLFATDHDLSRYSGRIRGIHFDLQEFNLLAAGFRTMNLPIGIGYQGATLGHPISDGEGELDLFHELLHLGIHRCATGDEFPHIAAKGRQQFVMNLLQDNLVQNGDLQHPPHFGSFNGGLKLLFVDFLDQERNCQDYFRFQVFEPGKQYLGSRDAIQKVDMIASGKGIEQVKAARIGMRQRQESQHLRAHIEEQIFTRYDQIGQ